MNYQEAYNRLCEKQADTLNLVAQLRRELSACQNELAKYKPPEPKFKLGQVLMPTGVHPFRPIVVTSEHYHNNLWFYNDAGQNVTLPETNLRPLTAKEKGESLCLSEEP